MRIHANFLEQLPLVIILLLISGLGFPLVAGGLGCGYSLARIIYGIGYYVFPSG